MHRSSPTVYGCRGSARIVSAASIAIDRKELNELVWNGLGEPRQASPVNGSPEYDPELEKKWAEYDPAKANQLLDQIGLTKGPDGFRRRSDGKTLELNVEHTSIAGSPEEDQHNRIKTYWEAVGLKTNMKFIERSLYEQRYRASEIEVGSWGCDRCPESERWRMVNRRAFIQQVGVLATAAVAFPAWQAPRRYKIGLQLFTLNAAMNRDPVATLQRVAALGYEEVETYGLNPDKLTYYGMPAGDFGRALRDHNLPTSDQCRQAPTSGECYRSRRHRRVLLRP